MEVFKYIQEMGHEQVIFCHDPEAGLKAIIAIHNTNLGPAMGGTRLLPYATEEDALKDVLLLSRAMTYKAACANLPTGGGKGVIITHPENKTDAIFQAYGHFVENLKGGFITGEDVNISVEDVRQMSRATRHVVGLQQRYGGLAPATAIGIACGIKAAVEFDLGKEDLKGLKVAVQGIGNVGKNLCQVLHEQGVDLFVSDLRKEKLEEVNRLYNATVVDVDEIYSLDVDVFSPCALGGILNSSTIPLLKASIVAGGANNQLENEEIHSRLLAERKILYCPDYVINAGGLINVYDEMMGVDENISLARVRKIADTLMELFQMAQECGLTTLEASKRLAEKRILKSKKQRSAS